MNELYTYTAVAGFIVGVVAFNYAIVLESWIVLGVGTGLMAVSAVALALISRELIKRLLKIALDAFIFWP